MFRITIPSSVGKSGFLPSICSEKEVNEILVSRKLKRTKGKQAPQNAKTKRSGVIGARNKKLCN